MRSLDAWRVDRIREPVRFVLRAPDGSIAGAVAPSGLRWDGLWRRIGLGARLDRIERDAWRDAGGRIPRHRRAVLEVADGTRVEIRNGAPHGPLRRAMDVRATIAGRRYRYAHTSGAAAEVRRDGVVLARAHAARSGVEVVAPLDATDELVVVVMTELCGPPGNPGAVRRVLHGLWDDAMSR